MESKVVATHRLRREGRWEDASEYRDEVRKQLQSEGKKRQEANEGAWEAMLEKYPPVDDEAVEDVTDDNCAEIAELAARSKGQEFDVIGDARWVYEQLSNGDVTPLDAPSLGAWGLLEWARTSSSNQKQFYTTFGAKLLVEQEEAKAGEAGLCGVPLDDEIIARENQSLQEIRRLLKEFMP